MKRSLKLKNVVSSNITAAANELHLKSKTMADVSRSHIYHNWETLVSAVIKKDEDRQLCYAYSFSSLDSTTPTISRTQSFEVEIDPLNGQIQHGGHVQQLVSPPRTLISLRPPKVLSSSKIGKIVGAARQLASKQFQIQWKKLSQDDVPENGIRRGSNFPTPAELEVQHIKKPTPEARDMILEELTGKSDNFLLIGEGCYGRVYLAQLNSGKCIAVKKLNVPSSESNSNDEFFTQASMFSRSNHESVVELLGYWVEGGIRILAYEYATMGSLHDILHGKKGELRSPPVLDWNRRVRIAIDAAQGLEYLHDKSIIHREIRCSNILLFEQHYRPKAKIADFGFSNQIPIHRIHSSQFLQTFGYPPEFAMDGQWTPKSDVYSFGVVLIELLTGREAVRDRVHQQTRSLVNWATPLLEEHTVRQCIDPRLGEEYPPKAAAKLAAIAARCLQYEAEFRPNMSFVVNHLQSLASFELFPV